jgi:3-dehydroquinate synthase
MAFTITQSHHRGYITDEERDQWFDLATKIGLTVDHPNFDLPLLMASVEAIKKTRDGQQRFVLAKPLGKCVFVNDITEDEFATVLDKHHKYVNERYPQTKGGAGIDGYADAGDLGVEVPAPNSNGLPTRNGLSNGAKSAVHQQPAKTAITA